MLKSIILKIKTILKELQKPIILPPPCPIYVKDSKYPIGSARCLRCGSGEIYDGSEPILPHQCVKK